MCITRQEFLRRVEPLNGVFAVESLCEELGLSARAFDFQGNWKGGQTTDEVPYALGKYRVPGVAKSGRYFVRSTRRPGDEVEFEGARWVVAYADFAPGSSDSYAGHGFVMVPADPFSPVAAVG